jgi:hypothetical protein
MLTTEWIVGNKTCALKWGVGVQLPPQKKYNSKPITTPYMLNFCGPIQRIFFRSTVVKSATCVLILMGAAMLCGSSASAQSYPYPSMFEANDAWRGRIRYHRGPFGGERYFRRWGNGITDNGLALGTSFFGSVTSVLTNPDFLELLTRLTPGLSPETQMAPEPELFDEEITAKIDLIQTTNIVLLSDLNAVRELFKDEGLAELKFESGGPVAEDAKSEDPPFIDPSGVLPPANSPRRN